MFDSVLNIHLDKFPDVIKGINTAASGEFALLWFVVDFEGNIRP